MRKFLAVALAWALLAVPVYAESVSAPAISLPVSVANGGTGVTALPSWSISLGTNQTGVPSATLTPIAFDTALFDATAACDIVTNKGRCTPQKAGKYRVSAAWLATGTFSTTSPGYCDIYKNGVKYKEVNSYGNTAGVALMSCTGLVDLNGTTDYVAISMQMTTSASTVTINSGAVSTWFDGEWAGP